VEKLHILRSVPIYFVIVFFSVSSALAVDPSKRIAQYAHTAWRIQDGFFSGTPNAITQTADGYLWIGTQNGLVRFDGVRFVPWTPPAAKFLSSGIFSLLAGADGSLWIGTGGNLAHLRNGDLINYADAPGRFNTIMQDRNGTVWVARSRVPDRGGPLCQVVDTKLRCYGKADGIDPPYAGPLIEDREGNLWIGSANVLTRWRSGSSATFAPPALKGTEGLSGIQALAVARDGSIWSGINRRGTGLGLQQFVQGIWKPFVTPELNGSALEVTALFVDHENALWVGTTDQGIYRIHDGNSDHFSGADGLSSDSVSGFYEDRENNIWVATSEGIDCFRNVAVTSISTREGLTSNLVDSVLAARDGSIWIGNHGALELLRDGRLSFIRVGDGLPGERVTSLLEDHAGHLWVGIDNELYVYETGKFHQIKHPKGTPMGVVVAITEDQDRDVWAEALGHPRKLVRIRDREVREEITVARVPAALSLAADLKDGIWLGLANGDLARYRHGQLETFPLRSEKAAVMHQVLVRADGAVLGASSAGLVEWRDGTLRTLTGKNGLPCDNLYALVLDGDNAVWLYAQCGLMKVAPAELQEWWDRGNTNTIVKVETLDVFDGARPSSAAFQPHSSRSPDGRLWFTNESVVQTIDPGHLNRNTLAPPVRVEAILADHKSYSTGAGVRLPPKTRDLEIDYAALSFVAPQKVRFRYKLEGHDADWQDPGTRRQAFYNDLRPGQYRFRVIACNNDGLWNKDGAALDFSIAPAWYQTKWFLASCLLGTALLVWAFIRWRMWQMHKALSARFDERLAERTRMARELHDTFLQTLQGSKLVAEDALEKSSDPMQMRRALEQLSVWLAQAVQEARAALNSLRTSTMQKNDLAEAFKRATEEGRLLSPMDVSFSVSGESKEMHPIVRDEIYRIGYEAIRNACTHSRGGRLEVALKYGHDLAVQVRDNGVGIDPTLAEQGKDGHFGLQGMRERVERIGAKLTVVSSADSGTEITVIVPGSIVFRKPIASPLEKIRTMLRRAGPTSRPD
jgi:signal transduction histidine kinase/ligand-binding sensor domain-containing protein